MKRLDGMCCANLSKAKKSVLSAFLAEVYGSREDSMLGNTLITLTLKKNVAFVKNYMMDVF